MMELQSGMAFWVLEAVQQSGTVRLRLILVALESTNMVPLTIEVRTKWARPKSQ